ncbi:hypothetical protein CMI47_22320 [Candidatus Pacearchaeota archaeon]|nr:hypothetical protein [Candidatus Pacearchaeota archaeon]|tara:strand:+ start:6344 stop:6637 length:294 start_codon:yes stop_codon:yes gene_type:complete
MFEPKGNLPELRNYIKKNLKKGYTSESLKYALLNQDYSRLEIEKALNQVNKELASKAPQLRTKPKIKYEIVEPKELAQIHNIEKKSFMKKLVDFYFS